MQGEGADEGEAVDVAEMDFSGKQEEGAEEEEEEDWAREVGVVHYVLGDGVQGVQYRERLLGKIAKGVSQRFACCISYSRSRRVEGRLSSVRFFPQLLQHARAAALVTYLSLYMPEIHPQLLQ